jgi:hypothetical protein
MNEETRTKITEQVKKELEAHGKSIYIIEIDKDLDIRYNYGKNLWDTSGVKIDNILKETFREDILSIYEELSKEL